MTQLHSAIEFSTNQYELRAEFSKAASGKNVDFALYARPIAQRDTRSSVANVNGIMGDLLDALELSKDEGNVQFEESDWVLSKREASAVAERILDWMMTSLLLKAGEVDWIDEALDADRAEGEWEERHPCPNCPHDLESVLKIKFVWLTGATSVEYWRHKPLPRWN